MKILQVLCGGAWGGGSVVVLAIVRALIERGDEVWVVCTDDENACRFEAAGARIIRPRFWFHSINPLDVIPFAELVAVCIRQRFDLVATHTSKGGFLGRLAARAAGVPHIVYHAHAFFFNHIPPSAKRKFYIALERIAARAGHLILCVSEDHRQGALEAGIERPERMTTIHNGIDLRPFAEVDRDSGRRRFGFGPTDILIGSVGRLTAFKGFEYVLRAMPSVLAQFPSAKFLISGEGPLEGELRQEAAMLGVSDSVHFLGFRRDVPYLLAALDVFVQPSLREGLSISLIEALAAGRPAVACKIHGNGEIIDDGETGLLVPPADPAAIAQALHRILRDPAFADCLARNARVAAQLRFSEDRMVRENLAVYDQLAAATQVKASSKENTCPAI